MIDVLLTIISPFARAFPRFWFRPTVEQSWAQRVHTLRQRAAALGYARIGQHRSTATGFYRHSTTGAIIRVNEHDTSMLFPGETPSDEPHYHGRRYMTTQEIDIFATERKRAIFSSALTGAKRARNEH